ncbi:MAG: biopolymer transporter ExbD [Alphaproteobacteria bacterium]|jgi:biopolymer transport protein ExbD|nr:biopolymer transporter ExbD [Alphaproteobacteria bacterium]
MRIPAPARRPRSEAIVPMINVVFLLLIFFMMTSRIAPTPPFAVTPPTATPEALAEGKAVLWIAPDGLLAFGALRGDAVWPALAALPADATLTVTADASLPATRLAAILSRLDADRSIELMVRG